MVNFLQNFNELKYGKLRPLCLFCIWFTSEEPGVLFSPGSSRLLTNSGTICSANEESTRLVFYLKQHHHQPPTSEIWKSNVFECYLANLYLIPKCVFEHYPGTSPLLQQCAHPVKWIARKCLLSAHMDAGRKL